MDYVISLSKVDNTTEEDIKVLPSLESVETALELFDRAENIRTQQKPKKGKKKGGKVRARTKTERDIYAICLPVSIG